MKLAYLADHAAAIPQLAQWHHDHWSSVTPHLTLSARIAGFRSRAGRLAVPTSFVALVDDMVVGMACLVAHDMETRPELKPWLATVLVSPEYRNRGIGSALAERVVDEARVLGYARLYLVTFDRTHLYWRLGWRAYEETEYLGLAATIMSRQTGATS
jgi:GNAT superfamily N-acetyltransferase